VSPRPPRAHHVVLHLPGADAEFQARVDDADDEVLTLVLTTPPAGVDGLRDKPAVVEYTTPRGLFRLSGAISGKGEEPGVLRVRRDGHDDVIQRRDFVRVEAVMPLQVTITDPLRGAAHTTTLNVSAGGVLVQDPLGIPAGSAVDLELELVPGQPPVRAQGRVVREAGEDAKGVQIESIAHADRERLVRYVTERERHALRVARGR